MRSQLNYSSYPKILPIIIQYNQAILMHGGIYRCTGIYFFKSASVICPKISFYGIWTT